MIILNLTCIICFFIDAFIYNSFYYYRFKIIQYL